MRRWWPSLKDMNRTEWLAIAPLVVLVVVLGVYPGPVLDAIGEPVRRIIEGVAGSAGLTSLRLPW
jgi:NADH:ubiquinone oxidoreductase subunit 4 (subunit M)